VAEREKLFFLPEEKACGFAPEHETEQPEPAGIYPCPCCGYLTFPVPKESAVAFICPVCYWENDVFAPGEDAPSDENGGMTLRGGRGCRARSGRTAPYLL